jgi:hypothetical protein
MARSGAWPPGFTPANGPVEQAFCGTQGLVGQAALENPDNPADDVPDYLKISSGRAGTPRHVLVVPLHHDAQVSRRDRAGLC